MSKLKNEKIPDMINNVSILADNVEHSASTNFPNNYPGIDSSWNLESFKQGLQVTVNSLSACDMSFDLIGVDASIANALRRTMISEVPSMAIEDVYIELNTSIMYDEIFAHRLGLIPLAANPDMFEWKSPSDPPTDLNTLVYSLDIVCKKDGTHSTVFSSDLEWKPHGEQTTKFSNASSVGPVNDDIVLVKLRPGDMIKCEVHARKGTGYEHAKWTPVSTASYRLLPDIRITSPITGPSAHRFQKCFTKGVIDIQEIDGVETAVVVNARLDGVSRECLRHDEFKDKVVLSRIREHFIFGVESVGAYTPEQIVLKSCDILKEKCQVLLTAIQDLETEFT